MSKWDSGEVRRGSRDGSRSGRGTGRPVNSSRGLNHIGRPNKKSLVGHPLFLLALSHPGALGTARHWALGWK